MTAHTSAHWLSRMTLLTSLSKSDKTKLHIHGFRKYATVYCKETMNYATNSVKKNLCFENNILPGKNRIQSFEKST